MVQLSGSGEATRLRAERAMNVKELAAFLDINTATVYRWVRRQKAGENAGPPAYKIGGKLIFFESQVREWLQEQRVGIKRGNCS